MTLRRSFSRTAVFALFFVAAMWPALVNGGALWFADLEPYVKGGFVAVQTVLPDNAAPTVPVVAAEPGSESGLAAEVTSSVSGVRSIAYSVFAYTAGLTLPGFLGLVLVQSAVLAFVVRLFAEREAGPMWLYALAVACGAGAIGASQAGPDIWAGLLVLSALLIARHRPTLGKLQLGAVLLIIVAAIAAHASHLLLGGALAVGMWAWPRLSGQKRGGGLLLIGGVSVAAAGIVATSLIGFGEASLAPKRYPIVLARAIEDGPALWHLEEHCDEYEYTVCEIFPDEIPDDVGSFLWQEGGIRDLATPEQMDAVRAEESLILRRAFMEYPFHQVRKAATNFARQSAMVALPPRFGPVATYQGEGVAAPIGDRRMQPLSAASFHAQQAMVVASLLAIGGIVAWRRGRLGNEAWQLVALCFLGLLANAAICGVLSVPVPRYQARVAWVLPLVAIMIVAPFLARRGQGAGQGSQDRSVGEGIRRSIMQMVFSRWCAMVAGLVGLVVLSRLITPAQFGVYAALLAVTLLAEAVCDLGIAARLVQRERLSSGERSAGEGLALLLTLLGGAALAGAALGLPQAILGEGGRTALLLLAAGLPFMGIAKPLEADLSRRLDFGFISLLGVVRAVLETGVAIALALNGAGAASLAGGLLASKVAYAVILLALRLRSDHYRPKLAGARPFLSFGGPYAVMEAAPRVGDAVVLQLFSGLLGFSALGLFDRAKRVTALLDRTLLDGVMPVVLPALSRSLDAGDAPLAVYLRKVNVLAALLWPAFGVIALLADQIVAVLLGPQWPMAVSLVRLLCLAGLALPISKMSMKMFVALDIVPAYARIQIIHQIVRAVFIGAGALHSIEAACLAAAATSFVKCWLIERDLGPRLGLTWAGLLGAASGGAWLACGAAAVPVILLLSGSALSDLATLAIGGIGAVGGWFAVAALTRHPLLGDIAAAAREAVGKSGPEARSA